MLLNQIINIAKQAGAQILAIYNDKEQAANIAYKADNSPLTLADKASNNLIVNALAKLEPAWPILSEEEAETPYHIRKQWNTFWLVDPLDGTKEFINRNGEFTVNIALIQAGKPMMGVIYVPVTDVCYWGDEKGAFMSQGKDQPISLHVNNTTENRIAVRSKSHAAPEEEKVLATYKVTNSISVGSSLKFCMLAQGKADVYYRHGPTMEWDTAAGQAIVEAAGGHVYQGDSQKPFRYNKQNLLNGSFLCVGF